MVNWEFFDNQTPDSARQLVDDLRAGNQVSPTRGPARLCTWREASRILAGFNDGQATDGPQAGPASLVGLELAKERGWTAPAPEHVSGEADQLAGAGSSAGSGPAGSGVSHADAANPRPGSSLGKESS
jgi:NADH-quinone oxidoreductase subunit E